MEGKFAGERLHSLPFLVVEVSEGIILKRGPAEIHIEGEFALETILLILTATSDKGLSPEEICLQFPKPDRDQVMAVLEEMYAKRLLVSVLTRPDTPDEESNADVFYWTAGTTQNEVVRVLSELRIAIVGVNRITKQICRSLTGMGVSNLTVIDDPLLRNVEYFTDAGRIKKKRFNVDSAIVQVKDVQESLGNCQCLLASSDFGGQALLLPWNELCVQQNVHFMPVYLQDMIGYVGPLVIPGDTACLQCVRMRQNAHLLNWNLIRKSEDEMYRGQSIAAIHPSMITILAETTVFELCHFYGALSKPRPGRLIVINLPEGLTERKYVLKIPRCPICSLLVKESSVQKRKLTPLPE